MPKNHDTRWIAQSRRFSSDLKQGYAAYTERGTFDSEGELTLYESIDNALAEWKGHPCILDCDKRVRCTPISAVQLREQIRETSDQLSRWGIKKNCVVPLFLRNSIMFIEVFLALVRLQAIPVMVKMEFRRFELNAIFSNCAPQAVICEEDHIAVLEPFLKGLLVIARAPGGLRLVQSEDIGKPSTEFPADVASLNYTYRGYGYPLAAMVSHAQYLTGAADLQAGLQGERGKSMLMTIPMSHIFTLVGCIVVPLLWGMSSVITQSIHPKILFQLIRELRIAYCTSVPELYMLLLRLRENAADYESLQAIVSGGTILNAEQYDQLTEGFGVEVLHGYGLTEYTPVSRNMRASSRAGTIGPVCDSVDCRIDAPSGETAGEILIRSPSMVKGYFMRRRETQESFDGAWFKTGDRGYFDGDHLVFLEEIKNTRKINGNIVDLEELRNVILLDKQVAEVRIQHRHNSLSARCKVARNVVCSDKEREIGRFLKGMLAAYKIPKIVVERP